MKIRPSLSALALILSLPFTLPAAPTPAAAPLKTLDGKTLEGAITSVHTSLVVVAAKKKQSITPLSSLDEASLNKVADFLIAQSAATSKWETSNSAVAKSLRKKLLARQGDKLVPLTLGDRPEPEFYLAYCSAHWCPPCRAFTPKLVEEYQRLQAKYPSRFELVFISSDHSSDDQATYVREANMPWPVLKLSATDTIDPLEQWHGRGIPDLIVTNREGQVFLKSYDGDTYLGPNSVLSRFAQLLEETSPTNAKSRAARYPLENILHVRASATNPVAAKPYLLPVNSRRYQPLGVKEILADLKIDATGKVAEIIATTPALPEALLQQLKTDSEQWRFLPAAAHGQGQECTAQFPIAIPVVAGEPTRKTTKKVVRPKAE